jgi:hypothetical protein
VQALRHDRAREVRHAQQHPRHRLLPRCPTDGARPRVAVLCRRPPSPVHGVAGPLMRRAHRFCALLRRAATPDACRRPAAPGPRCPTWARSTSAPAAFSGRGLPGASAIASPAPALARRWPSRPTGRPGQAPPVRRRIGGRGGDHSTARRKTEPPCSRPPTAGVEPARSKSRARPQQESSLPAWARGGRGETVLAP